MTRKEIKNRVFEIIADKIGVSVHEIQESTRFKEDLGTDSLDDVELLFEFEYEFGIVIPDEETATVCTVGEAIDGICQEVGVSICKKQQLEVDLEKDIARFALNGGTGDNTPTIGEVARHFYELGLNARTIRRRASNH